EEPVSLVPDGRQGKAHWRHQVSGKSHGTYRTYGTYRSYGTLPRANPAQQFPARSFDGDRRGVIAAGGDVAERPPAQLGRVVIGADQPRRLARGEGHGELVQWQRHSPSVRLDVCLLARPALKKRLLPRGGGYPVEFIDFRRGEVMSGQFAP